MLDLVGGRSLSEAVVAEALVGAFDACGLAPDEYAIGEPPGPDYNREVVLRMLIGGRPTSFSLHRRASPAFSATLFVGNRPRILIRFESPEPTHFDAIFGLGHALAAAQRPHVGWLQPLSGIEPPCEEPAKQARLLIDEGCDGCIASYDEHGPGGLGLRTWMGAQVVERIGRERLASAPLAVLDLDGGGVQLDLLNLTLGASDEAMVEAWQAAMAVLEPAEVFACPQWDDGYVDFIRGARFNVDPYV